MIKKIILLSIIFFNIVLTVSAKDLRFVQVAEVMYTTENSAPLTNCINDINTLKNIDFVVFTGDNIAAARIEYLKGFLKEVKKLNYPVYIIIGDKDVSKEKGLNKETYREEVFKSLGFGQSFSPNYTFKKGNVRFIAADGAKEFVTASNGYYKQNTVDWIDKMLTKYQKDNVIILQHFPLIKGDIPANNTYKVELYTNMLNKHSNVFAIIAGHFKKNEEQLINNVNHIITPSYSITGEYKILDIPEGSDVIYTQLRHVD